MTGAPGVTTSGRPPASTTVTRKEINTDRSSSTELEVLFQWIIYLEGGGWCWNSTSCLNRLVLNGIFFGGSHLVSSSQWPPVKTYEDGIFVMEGSGWAEANLVYLPYCSSDAHMGDTQVRS